MFTRRKRRLLHVSLDSTNQDVREKHLGRQTNGIPSQKMLIITSYSHGFPMLSPFVGAASRFHLFGASSGESQRRPWITHTLPSGYD